MSNEAHAKAGDERGSVRERILDAALAILGEDGVSALSQVQVARRAGVRQSHLTYYFPKRHDLINAVAERFVGALACDARRMLSEPGEDIVSVLQRLSRAISQREHMRMFLGAIVEADRDPDVRAIMMRETDRLQTALAEVLEGEDATERARLILASLWGLGLYGFLAGTPVDADATFLARLAGGNPPSPEQG